MTDTFTFLQKKIELELKSDIMTSLAGFKFVAKKPEGEEKTNDQTRTDSTL